MCENCFGEIQYDIMQNLDAETVERVVLAHYKLTMRDLRSRHRNDEVGHARAVTMYLVRNFTKLSFPEIGKRFGRHHTTVMSNCLIIKHQLSYDPKVCAEIAQLINNLILSVPVQLRFPFVNNEVAYA